MIRARLFRFLFGLGPGVLLAMGWYALGWSLLFVEACIDGLLPWSVPTGKDAKSSCMASTIGVAVAALVLWAGPLRRPGAPGALAIAFAPDQAIVILVLFGISAIVALLGRYVGNVLNRASG